MRLLAGSRFVYRMRNWHGTKSPRGIYYPSLTKDECYVVDGGTILVLSEPAFATDPRNISDITIAFAGMIEKTSEIAFMFFAIDEIEIIP